MHFAGWRAVGLAVTQISRAPKRYHKNSRRETAMKALPASTFVSGKLEKSKGLTAVA